MVDGTTIRLLSSEIVLLGVLAFLFLAGTFVRRAHGWWPVFTALAFAALLAIYGFVDRRFADFQISDSQGIVLNGPLVVDLFGLLLRQFALVIGLLLALLCWRRHEEELTSERMGMIVALVIGLLIVARANDLVLMFVGLETVSIPTYVLMFLGRRDRGSAESTMKYFFLSVFSSALVLYGFSFLFGLGGSTQLVGAGGIQEGVARAVAGSPASPLVPLALILLLGGLGFKITAVPFHFYAPDVYQGTTNSNAGLLSVAPKIAGFLALIRVYVAIVPERYDLGWQLPLGIAVLTMTLGNVCALWQRDLRRMLAYSSIAHSGYMLMGIASTVAAARSGGIAAVIFYLIAYSLTSLAVFGAFAFLESQDRPLQRLEDLSGLGKSNPLVATAIAVSMFSFAGIPILAGFWGKFGLFTSVLQAAQGAQGNASWFLFLAIAGAVNAAIAAAYYLRLISTMYFQEARGNLPLGGGLGPFATMLASTILIVGIGLFPGITMQRARLADESLPQPSSGTRMRAEHPPAQPGFQDLSRADEGSR
ncbi:MAG: NADH-quinone oxidoreductase subunit N [Planctomycetes bacterium]|nr:NADH-quinone oxidoreductase subunit N [Planctomycetota bacterium]